MAALMSTAPQGTTIVILTPFGAHRSDWDTAYSNFWSHTAGRALLPSELLCWMNLTDWLEFVASARSAAEEPCSEGVNI